MKPKNMPNQKPVEKQTMKQEPKWPLYGGVFLVSLSILCLEVILTRMFSLTFWYHFGFIILSVALFGIGFGGLLVFFTNRFLKSFAPITLMTASILLAVSIPIVLIGINQIPLEMNEVAASALQKGYLTHFLMLLLVPFILGGYIFSFLFTNYKENINKIYFFDLIGGGIGCFFALIVFPHNGPMIVSVIISGIVIIAAALFVYEKHWIFSIAVLLFIALDIYIYYPMVKNVEIRISGDKRHLEYLGVKKFSDWDNFAYVAVHERPSGSWAVTADYSCFTYLYPVARTNDFSEFKRILSVHYYPYLIKEKPQDVGIVGVGAGKDVLLALAAGAKEIRGAEFNATIYHLFHDVYSRKIGNIGHFSNVDVEFQEGRFFIRSSDRKYDVLIFDNSISQVAVSSGSFTLAESYLFTVEGMMDYISHLKPGGVIYLSNPYTDGPRFVTLIREAFHRMHREKEFGQSVMIFEEPASYRKCKILIKNGLFTEKESAKLIAYARSIGQILEYSPYVKSGTREERLVRADDINREYALNDTEIRPSTDDWPFFSQRVKPQFLSFSKGVDAVRFFYPQPFLLLKEVTGQVVFYCILFLIAPLIFLNLKGFKKLPHKVASIIYFASLGLGFMLLEVVMMQKYTLILGHPIFAFAVVLSSLLISSGIGSMFSHRYQSPKKAILIGLAGIVATTVFSYLFILLLGGAMTGWLLFIRILFIVALIAPTGFFMGFMMPSGIRVISESEEGDTIPWMWSVNGVFSVLASFVAIYVSVLFGYTLVFILGIAVYTLGTAVFALRMGVSH